MQDDYLRAKAGFDKGEIPAPMTMEEIQAGVVDKTPPAKDNPRTDGAVESIDDRLKRYSQ